MKQQFTSILDNREESRIINSYMNGDEEKKLHYMYSEPVLV